MEKNTRSYQQIFNFASTARGYLTIHKDETKLKYAIERTLESLNSNIKTYQSALADLRLDNAFVNDKGVVPFTTNDQGVRTYEYSKDGIKALDKAIEDLFQSKVEVSVHYATELPGDFEEPYREIFEGFVIKEEKAAKSKGDLEKVK